MTRRRTVALILAAGSLAAAVLSTSGQAQTPPARLVAIFVVDGLRPDSINAADTPTIARLRAEGAEYLNSHSIFPTVTRVNAAALATGAYPVLTGIVGNSMFAAGVNAQAPFDTGDYTQLLKLGEAGGRTVTVDTLGEILHRRGRKLVTVSSGSTGNGYLLNPEARRGAGVVIHGLFERGSISAYPKDVSDTILRRFGSPPPDPDDLGQMRWTDDLVREYVLPELRPDVLIDWMGPLDSTQHQHGAGSPQAKEALRQIDASLSQTIGAMGRLGLLPRTDIIITSDHGFAHHGFGVDAIDALVNAGLKASRDSTEVIVASQSQSLLLYVEGRAADRVAKIVRFLQAQPWVDVLFTAGGRDGQGGVLGTFSFDLIGAAHPDRRADIVVSLSWTSSANAFGVPGTHTIHGGSIGPLSGNASGHGGLNPWVIKNTFIAWGRDFKPRARVDAPVALPDIAPTVLALSGLEVPSGAGRGRVLRELLTGPAAGSVNVTRRTITTSAGAYRARLEVSNVDGRDYVDGGSK